jgi:hypothetical protein
MKKKKPIKRLMGYCPVDSGQLIVIDPCYLREWEDGEVDFDSKEIKNDYDQACKLSCSKKKGGTMAVSQPFGNGVVFQTGMGDGNYPVFATIKDNMIKEITIKFF